MTYQSTRDQREAPVRSADPADPAWSDPYPADHGTTDIDTGPEAAGDESVGDARPVDRSGTEQAGTEQAGTEQAAGHFDGVTPHGLAEPQPDAADHGDVSTRGATAVVDPNGRYGVAAPTTDVSRIAATGPGELPPGDLPQEPVMALLDGSTADRFRTRWQQLQLRFIDDPQAVATEAGGLVDEVVTALRDAIDQRRAALEDGQSSDGVDARAGDTERLRIAVRRYRVFLDHLLGQ